MKSSTDRGGSVGQFEFFGVIFGASPRLVRKSNSPSASACAPLTGITSRPMTTLLMGPGELELASARGPQPRPWRCRRCSWRAGWRRAGASSEAPAAARSPPRRLRCPTAVLPRWAVSLLYRSCMEGGMARRNTQSSDWHALLAGPQTLDRAIEPNHRSLRFRRHDHADDDKSGTDSKYQCGHDHSAEHLISSCPFNCTGRWHRSRRGSTQVKMLYFQTDPRPRERACLSLQFPAAVPTVDPPVPNRSRRRNPSRHEHTR